MISISLDEAFKQSVVFARKKRHEYLTIEHMFWSILQSQEGRYILQILNVDPDKLTQELLQYIENTMVSLSEEVEPFETVALSQAINDMMTQIHSSGRKKATIGDMIAAIFLPF